MWLIPPHKKRVSYYVIPVTGSRIKKNVGFQGACGREGRLGGDGGHDVCVIMFLQHTTKEVLLFFDQLFMLT